MGTDTISTLPEGVAISKMEEPDLSVLLDLGRRQWGEEEWLTMKYLKSSFLQKGLSYVARTEGRVVGGVILVYEDIVRNWIRYLIVDKEYRNRGIGGSLLAKVFSRVKEGESVFVDTGVTDKKAIAFYEAMGFKNRGMIKSLYGNESAYIFENDNRSLDLRSSSNGKSDSAAG